MLATEISNLKRMQRGELVLETGLTYDGIAPISVRAVKRDGRYEFSDDGGAVVAAGADRRKLRFPASIAVGEYTVNVTRHGVAGLPGFQRSSDEWLAKLPALVAEGSLALYEALLETRD